MLLTVSGPPGCGTSTAAAGLADALNYEHVSGGDIFRELAAENGYTLAEFNARAETDEEIDRALDRRLRTIAREREDLVLESRLAGWMAGEHADLKFWLDAPIDVRAVRIADREEKTPSQARAETEEREASERTRYREYYGIEIGDLSIYDMALNTARWDVEAMLELLCAAVDALDPESNEGSFPVTGVRYEF